MNIALTGGGTAGHVMPNMAILDDLYTYFDKVIYIGNQEKMEKNLCAKFNVPFFHCDSVKFDRSHMAKNLAIPFKLPQYINQAKKIQLERYHKYNIFSNSELTPKLIEKFCKLNNRSKKILETAFNQLGLSGRAYNRILKVARTIADLDRCKEIKEKHLAEAIQYRSLDRKYWHNKS